MTSSLDLTRLRRELDATHDRGRLARAIELGREATARPGAAALLEGLAAGDAYERRLGLIAQYTRRDGASVLRALEDPSRRVRALAFSLVPLCCDDPQAADGLQVAFALRRDRALAVRLRAHDRLAAVDHHLDWLAPRKDVHDFADLVALGSPDGIRRHLPQALLRPSQIFWKRLARYAPDVLGDVFAQRLRAVDGELDAMHRQLLDRHLFRIADAAPDTAMTLVELLHSRGIHSPPAVWKRLAVRRPTVTLSVMQRCGGLIPDGLFARGPGALSPAALGTLVRLAPRALGEPDKLFKALDADGRRAVVAAWCEQLRAHRRWMLDEGLLYWGRALIAHIDDRNDRDFAFDRWSEGARDRDGVVAVEQVAEHREGEDRGRLHGVQALGTRRGIPAAPLLPSLRPRARGRGVGWGGPAGEDGRGGAPDPLRRRGDAPRPARAQRPLPSPLASPQERAGPGARADDRRAAELGPVGLEARAPGLGGPDRPRRPRRRRPVAPLVQAARRPGAAACSATTAPGAHGG